ncbi:MAG: VOC family protein [Tardiphaga sp.]
MAVQTVTHLNFRGDARAALAFYQSVFGGDLIVVSYKDAGAAQNPGEADWVMWGQVTAASGFRVMAFDVPSQRAWHPGEVPFFVSVRGDVAQDIRGYWEGLCAGGTVLQPLGPSNWAPLHGMVKDRFGITWIVDVDGAAAAS